MKFIEKTNIALIYFNNNSTYTIVTRTKIIKKANDKSNQKVSLRGDAYVFSITFSEIVMQRSFIIISEVVHIGYDSPCILY